MESCSSTHFQSKCCRNLCESEFVRKIKQAPKQKLKKKKSDFGGQNDGIWPNNDERPVNSCSLTHLQSKSYTNLHEYEFQHKKIQAPKGKFSKKCHFGGRNDRIWRKTMNLLQSPTCRPISNRKAAQICLNMNSGAKKKQASKQKFSKKCHFGG